MNMITHCIKCGEEITRVTNVEEKQIPICTDINCSIYGVLQLGQEIMTEILEDIETNN